MDEMEKKDSRESTKKYLTIISLIDVIENRLKWSEIVFIIMNLMVIFALMGFLAIVLDDSVQPLNPIFLLFVLFSHAIGISINAYWMAFIDPVTVKTQAAILSGTVSGTKVKLQR